MASPLLIPVSVVLGAVIGSFLNVVIVRLPRGESIVTPRSRCPGCGTAIQWFDNLPVISFLALGGRCRQCGVSISGRYPLVEAATAGLFALAAWRATSLVDVLAAWIFLSMLVAIAGIDLEHQIIPDRITLPGIVVGLVTSLVGSRISWVDSLLGILAGGGILFAVIILSGGGMGGGDMKLGAMMGAFLGYKLVILALFMAVTFGGLVALALLASGLRRRKDAIPFGPFLAAGAAVAILSGDAIVTWYLNAFSS